jgi:hypothetical protein
MTAQLHYRVLTDLRGVFNARLRDLDYFLGDHLVEGIVAIHETQGVNVCS